MLDYEINEELYCLSQNFYKNDVEDAFVVDYFHCEIYDCEGCLLSF